MICTSRFASPLGDILLEGDGEGLTGLWFREGSRYFAAGLRQDTVSRETACFGLAKEWLTVYFSGRDPGFLPPLRLTGPAFRRRVLGILLGIPFGETVTYGQIAGQIAAERGIPRMSAQAVGGAVARNPISLIVPCHRVVGADGRLVGYGGGLARKKALLDMEAAGMSRLPGPG